MATSTCTVTKYAEIVESSDLAQVLWVNGTSTDFIGFPTTALNSGVVPFESVCITENGSTTGAMLGNFSYGETLQILFLFLILSVIMLDMVLKNTVGTKKMWDKNY